MRIAIVMPAYNAEALLGDVVQRCLEAAGSDLERLVVVNDGSTDDTGRIATELADREPHVVVVNRLKNGGYGAAMKDGLRAAREGGATVAASVHADGQYAPEELPRLAAEIENRGLDLLQGSRIASGTARSGGMPLYKLVGGAALNVLERRAFRLPFTDFHSGYLVYGARALQELPFHRLSNSFDFDLEVIAAALAARMKVAEAPIPTHYGDELSHLNPVTYGLRVLRVMWRYRRGHYARESQGSRADASWRGCHGS